MGYLVKKWKFLTVVLVLIIGNFFVWSAFLGDSNIENKVNSIPSKSVFETINPDSLTFSDIMKFVVTDVDTFTNDTTFIVGDNESTSSMNKYYNYFLIERYIVPGYPSGYPYINFYINKYNPSDREFLYFKFGNNDIESVIVNIVNTGSDMSLLSWYVGNKSDYRVFDRIRRSNKVTLRIMQDSNSDMQLSKSQLNSLKLFYKFLENKGFSPND